MNLNLSCYMFPIIVVMIIMGCNFSSIIAMNNETDRLALLEIKAKINDPFGVLQSWNDSVHFCMWYGVSCGRRHQRVTVLNLQSSKLTGTLLSSVGNLSFLKVLNLDSNNFGGVIPSEIGRLHRLQYLLLGNNSIGGEIPSNISSCSSLIQMDIVNNRLVGQLPYELGFLSRLQHLTFSANNMTGTIPPSLGNLSSLVTFHAASNIFSGSIPESLGKLANLTVLALAENKLSGTIPSSVFNLSFMTILDLGENTLEGNLPSDLGNLLPQLQVLSLGKNWLTGVTPTSISNSTNLEYLQLPSNNLEGEVPSLHKLHKLQRINIGNNNLGLGQANDLNFVSSLVNASMLQVFIISKNSFAGKFPGTICNFTILSFLGFQLNNITGQIPNCIVNLAYLQYIGAWRNQLSGVIPKEIGKLQSLVELDLTENQFSGHIPVSIGNLSELTLLQFAQNNLEGQIPSTLGNCMNLLGLDLSQNNLSGSVPSQIFSLSSLSIGLYLSNNHLTGFLPDEVGHLINLESLDVAENMLSGEIPSTIGACILLNSLKLEGNFFQGAIPRALEMLKGLHELDLSRNNFSGHIPKNLAILPLQVLNLSFNHLDGAVPIDGVFKNGSSVSVSGNSGLCGGIPELELPKCNSNIILKKEKRRRIRSIIAILSGVLGIILLVGYISWHVCCYRKRRKETKIPDDSQNNLSKFSYQTLLKATDGFSSENLIGSGTFGMVYKGVLEHDERKVVAVKVFKLEQHAAYKSFLAECGALQNIKHRNLVKVVTACSSVDYQGIDFKALVYEYMVNGSLEDWLHPSKESVCIEERNETRNLKFFQRLDIAVDVAFALEYLHHHCGTPIVHCDLKPSNILLDEEMVAHVGDFGLAKFLTEDSSNSFASKSSSFGVRGTIGYTPPEYGLGNEVSTLGDVYSFGILLLEMFTGMKPTFDMFRNGQSLHQYVKEALPERVTEILDNSLLEDIVGAEITGSMILEALISLFGIALSCSEELAPERLNMNNVAAKLSVIRQKLR